MIDELIGLAKTALAEADPWRGFTRFVEEALVLHARNRALMDVVETQKHGRERAISMRRRIRPLVAQLVSRAHADGSLRPDFTPQDVAVLMQAFERALGELGLRDRKDPAAIALAKLVIHLAKEGERDPLRLCERAVMLMSR